MSKKEIRKLNAEKDEGAIKKSRRRKFAGKIFASVFVLLFVGIVIGTTVGSYKLAESVWNENIGNEAQVPFNELFSLFKGVRKNNEKDVVSNAFADEDLTAFYANIKNKMYLAEDYDLDVMKILSKVLAGEEEENSTDQESAGDVKITTQGTYGYDFVYVYEYKDGRRVESREPLSDEDLPAEDGGQEEQPSQESTGNSALDELLKEIQFDFSSLADYDGSKNILEISDKQLAAFIDEVLGGIGEFFPALKEMETSMGSALGDLLQIKQIIIFGDVSVPQSAGLKITLNVKLRNLMSAFVQKNPALSYVRSLMPQNIYASATVYPCDRDRAIQVSINKMSEVNVEKIVRIADVVLKKTGSNMSLSKLLVDVNSKVVDTIEKAQNVIPLSFVTSGSMELYPIETLMKTLKVDVSEQAFLTMIRDVKLPNAQSLGFDIYTPEVKLNDTREFITEVSAKYGIDNTDGKIGEQNTIADVMNFAQGESVLNSINLKSIDYSGEYTDENVKVGASYQALSHMLSSYVNENEMLGTIKAKIVNMSSNGNGDLSIDIEVNVAQMLGFNGEDTMAQLIRQLVPESIFATATIDLQNLQPTSVEINKVGVENSQNHLQTLTALASSFNMDVSSLSYESICSQVDSGIKQGLAQVKEKIGYDIQFNTDKAYLPSLYEIISGTSIVNGDLKEDEHYFTPQEIRNMLKHLYTFVYDEENDGFDPKDNMDGFIDQLYQKYFISDSYKQTLLEASRNNTLLEAMTNIGGDNFDISKIRLDDIINAETGIVTPGLKSRLNVTDMSGVGDDEIQAERIKEEIIRKFNPVFTLEETAHLLSTQVNFAQSITFMNDVQIVYANNYSAVGDDYLEIIIKGKGAISNANATSLLPEFMYIGIKIDLGKIVDGNRSDMKVFQMDVNSLEYNVEEESKLQDLQLLLMLIDRVNGKSNAPSQPENPSEPDTEPAPEPEPPAEPAKQTSLEEIIANIEEKLNGKKEDGNVVEQGFKDKIHNNVFTVTFVDNGGFRLDQTVYQIALNSIYGDDARLQGTEDKPSEIDFRNSVCKINNMPDEIIIDSVALSLKESNKSDANKAVDEINEKYALKDESKLDASNLNAVLTNIGDKVGNYATAIDGQKLVADFADGTKKTLENLRPKMAQGELLNFLENSVNITAQGYEDTQMLGLYIVNEKEMAIVYKSKVKTGDGKYAQLLPVDIAMVVKTDTSLIKSDEICTSIVFNDLSQSEAIAIDKVRNKMNAGGAPSDASDLDSANKKCSDSVKNSMKPLTDNMDLRFSVENGSGSMIMDGIYEIAANKVNSANVSQSEIKAQSLKDTLESLFAGLDLRGYTGAAKNITATVLAEQQANFNIYASSAGINGIIGDGNISSKIDVNTLKTSLGMSNVADANALTLAQSGIICAGDLDALRNSLGYVDGESKVLRLSADKEWMLFTFSASMQSAIGRNMSILPEKMFVTVFVDIDDADGRVGIAYNSLTDSQTDTLKALMNANAEGASGFTDAGNFDKVKDQLMNTVIINNPIGGTDVTLGTLLQIKRGMGGGSAQIMPIADVIGKSDGVVVGTGALSFNINS